MDTSDWIALVAVIVSIVSLTVGYRMSRRSAVAAETSSAAAMQSAASSASSADASRRSAEVAERAENRALADREDARGPAFHVSDRQNLGGDRAYVPIAQVSGPELEKVEVRARGPVDGVTSPEGAGGSSWIWDRPLLHVQTTVIVTGKRPDRVLDAELVLTCYERHPGMGRWERQYPVHAVAGTHGPSPPPGAR